MRIVSLVPSLTELLVDLGLEKNIVGITKFCVHPSSLKANKTIVGGTKNCNFNTIKELKPNVIICNKEENTKEIVTACKQIAHTHVSNIISINDTLELIKKYGILFSKEHEAAIINNNLKTKISDFKNFIKNKKRIKVAYFIWRKPWMVVANSTFINSILQLNNFENVYSNLERYPEVTLRNLEQTKPDVIFLASEPYPFKEKHTIEIKNTTAIANIVFVNGEFFSWYGTRLLQSFDYFKKLHHSISQ